MQRMICVLLVTAAMLGGCATHEAMAPLAGLAGLGLFRDARQAGRLERSLTDGQIATLLDADVRAKLPAAIAIARLQSHCGGYQPYLATIDAKEMQAWEKCLEGQSLITGVHPISRLALGSDRVSMRALRQAAARQQCELLLVYLQADAQLDNFNEAAALYWSFVGLWLVPGNVIEHKTVMQAALVDCRTGVILGTATGDNHLKRICPAALKQIAEDGLARRAPEKALADLQTGCKRLLKNVVETAAADRARGGVHRSP